MPHASRTLVAALLLVVPLSACAEDPQAAERDDPTPTVSAAHQEPVAPAAGQCVARGVTDGGSPAPDFTTVVPCTAPHRYEVTGVVDLPSWALAPDSGTVEGRLALGDPDPETAEGARFAGFVLESCAQQARRTARITGIHYGGEELSTGRRSARVLLDKAITPAWWGVEHVLSLTPPDLWVAGSHQLVCSVGYLEDGPGSEPEEITSTTRRTVISQWSRRSFPVEHRACLIEVTAGPCDQTHNAEVFAEVDLGIAFPDRSIFTDLVRAFSQSDVCTAIRAGLTAEPLPADFWVAIRTSAEGSKQHKVLCVVGHLNHPPLLATRWYPQPAGFAAF